jgi:hypothetical protein
MVLNLCPVVDACISFVMGIHRSNDLHLNLSFCYGALKVSSHDKTGPIAMYTCSYISHPKTMPCFIPCQIIRMSHVLYKNKSCKIVSTLHNLRFVVILTMCCNDIMYNGVHFSIIKTFAAQ